MREAWKAETYVQSQSFSSESAVKYLHVGRRKIQISLPPGEQDQSNALPQGQQRQSNPHPMPCLPPRRHYIDRCITGTILVNQLNYQIRLNCYIWTASAEHNVEYRTRRTDYRIESNAAVLAFETSLNIHDRISKRVDTTTLC